MMIRGIDRFVDHRGHRYLIECEDLGSARSGFEVRVLEQGAILWSRSFQYDSEERGRFRSMRQAMERVYSTARAAIARDHFSC